MGFLTRIYFHSCAQRINFIIRISWFCKVGKYPRCFNNELWGYEKYKLFKLWCTWLLYYSQVMIWYGEFHISTMSWYFKCFQDMIYGTLNRPILVYIITLLSCFLELRFYAINCIPLLWNYFFEDSWYKSHDLSYITTYKILLWFEDLKCFSKAIVMIWILKWKNDHLRILICICRVGMIYIDFKLAEIKCCVIDTMLMLRKIKIFWAKMCWVRNPQIDMIW